MKNFNISRTLFQLFALGLFIYQFQNSIIKYVTGPVTTQTSTTTISEIQQPLIYLCQQGQFDIKTARSFGYLNGDDFTKGKIRSTNKYTWYGKNGTTPYHKMQNRIYNFDYSKVLVQHSKTGDYSDYKIAVKEEVYFPPIGFCLNILSTQK